MDFDFRSPQAESSEKPLTQENFRILVLGDFSGRQGAGTESGTSHRPIPIDLDNFDQVINSLNIDLRLPVGDDPAQAIAIPLRKLDDFHPDQLVTQIDLFRNLRRLRSDLANPSTFDAAAEEARAMLGISPAPEAPASPAAPASVSLDDIFSQPNDSAAPPASSTQAILGKLVDDLVAPYSIPGVTPQQTQLVTLMDQAIARQLRAILHAPAFQSLESAWRALDLLLRRIGTESSVKIFLLDLSKEQLAAELSSASAVSSGPLHKILVEQALQTPGGQPWALLVGNYTFDQTPADVRLLALVSALAQMAGAPFIAAGHDHLVGCESIGQTPDIDDWQETDETLWSKLRDLPSAPYLALTFPRFLLRAPYGGSTNPTERIQFDEMAEPFGHAQHLWGNGAFLAAAALAAAFRESGWSMQLPDYAEFSRLPMYLRDVDGQRESMPCAEAFLIDRGIEHIHAKGLLPLISLKESDSIRFGNFQSVADPRTYLAGRWQ